MQAPAGRGPDGEQDKAMNQMKAALAERDEVIGELTVSNRSFKKSFGVSRCFRSQDMISRVSICV
jgi:hypothetical protein